MITPAVRSARLGDVAIRVELHDFLREPIACALVNMHSPAFMDTRWE